MMEEPTELSARTMREQHAVEVDTAPTHVVSAAPLKPTMLAGEMSAPRAMPMPPPAVSPPGTPLSGPPPRRRAQQWPSVEPPPRVTASLSGAVPESTQVATIVHPTHVGARLARGSEGPTRVVGKPRLGGVVRAAESAAQNGAYSVAREVAALAIVSPQHRATTQPVRRPDSGTVRVVLVGLVASIVILLSAVVVRQRRELHVIRGEVERYHEVCRELAEQQMSQPPLVRICTR
ncbi:MAG: hypothetical protein JWP01_83 [Myxococcales bacterium]|nr:hypothetical protein [Myxococcales bacterium]